MSTNIACVKERSGSFSVSTARESAKNVKNEQNVSDDSNDVEKVSPVFTIFNMMCSAIGMGVICIPSTLCGSGLYLGIILIVFFGFISDWSSRAVIKSHSLEEMYIKILGPWGSYANSIAISFLLIGATGAYVILMGIFTRDVFECKINFRYLSVGYCTLCGILLLFKNLKLLSYISLCKLFVILFILIITMSYASNEYDRRRPPSNNVEKPYAFHEEFPAWPSMLGLMKAMGALQASFLFHIGINDMYFTLKKRSYKTWSNISHIACLLIGIFNLGYAVIGFLATSDLKMEYNADIDAKDLCRNSKEIFLSLYENKPAVKLAQSLLLALLISSYPLLFFFLRADVLILFRNMAPALYEKKSENWWRKFVTVMLWIMILAFALITEDPFSIINFQCTIFGTLLVFLLPGLVWIKAFGGFAYVFSFGYFSAKPMVVAFDVEKNGVGKSNKEIIKSKKTEDGQEKDIGMTVVEVKNSVKTIELPVTDSILDIISAQFVFIMGVILMVIGCIVSLYGFMVEIQWRQNSFSK